MTPVFADTSFYIAISNPRDSLHQTALDTSRRIRGTVVTTDYVLIEVANWLSRSGDRQVFVELLARLKDDANTIVVESDHTLFEEGCALYAIRPDKDWSLTDCISFVVMQQQKLVAALTADHHFEQAGFAVLLK